MALPGYVETLLGGMEAGLRRSLRLIFDYVLANLTFGPPDDQTRARNFQCYYYTTTTPAVAETEFTIAHGLGTTPYLLLPVLNLQTVGAKVVPLTVTRAPDATRVYLSSTVASAPICVLMEG